MKKKVTAYRSHNDGSGSPPRHLLTFREWLNDCIACIPVESASNAEIFISIHGDVEITYTREETHIEKTNRERLEELNKMITAITDGDKEQPSTGGDRGRRLDSKTEAVDMALQVSKEMAKSLGKLVDKMNDIDNRLTFIALSRRGSSGR